MEEAMLSDGFWNVGLVQNLATSSTNSPYLQLFWAAQVKANALGFLSKDISIDQLISYHGDIHHIFPRGYLKSKGLTRSEYNQIANYVYMQSEINIKLGNKSPKSYFTELTQQTNGGVVKYGNITDSEALRANLGDNAIPETICNMEIDDYREFLEQRRKLMAQTIRRYYESL